MGKKKKKIKSKKKPPSSKKRRSSYLSKQNLANLEKIKSATNDGNLQYISYTITDEPIKNPWFDGLPKAVRNRAETFYDLIHKNPKQAIEELSELILKYPKVPTFYNYLSAAYDRMKDSEKRDAVVMECYQRFPEYLFGKLNYAQICLEKGEIEKIPEIFNNKFNLSLFYPHRSTFHVSEYAGFAGIVGSYLFHMGDREAANIKYKEMKKIVPDHPATQQLKKLLHPPLGARVSRWIDQIKGSNE